MIFLRSTAPNAMIFTPLTAPNAAINNKETPFESPCFIPPYRMQARPFFDVLRVKRLSFVSIPYKLQ